MINNRLLIKLYCDKLSSFNNLFIFLTLIFLILYNTFLGYLLKWYFFNVYRESYTQSTNKKLVILIYISIKIKNINIMQVGTSIYLKYYYFFIDQIKIKCMYKLIKLSTYLSVINSRSSTDMDKRKFVSFFCNLVRTMCESTLKDSCDIR